MLTPSGTEYSTLKILTSSLYVEMGRASIFTIILPTAQIKVIFCGVKNNSSFLLGLKIDSDIQPLKI